MGKLEGKIALITGGSTGIGLATAKQFVNEGSYVIIMGRRDSELAAAVKEVGGNVTGVQGDVSDLGDLDRQFAQIKREKTQVQRFVRQCRHCEVALSNNGGAPRSAMGFAPIQDG